MLPSMSLLVVDDARPLAACHTFIAGGIQLGNSHGTIPRSLLKDQSAWRVDRRTGKSRPLESEEGKPVAGRPGSNAISSLADDSTFGMPILGLFVAIDGQGRTRYIADLCFHELARLSPMQREPRCITLLKSR